MSFSHPKTKCVFHPPRVNQQTTPQRAHPFTNHAINSPEALAAVALIQQKIAQDQSMDPCYSIEQKSQYGHPLYHKWYGGQLRTENFPVHYTLPPPPTDYSTFLKLQKAEMAAKLGSNFEQDCFQNTKELAQSTNQETVDKTRTFERCLTICPKCRAKKQMKSIPHCCNCRCAHYRKLGWQNLNPQCIQEGDQQVVERPHILKSLAIKKTKPKSKSPTIRKKKDVGEGIKQQPKGEYKNNCQGDHCNGPISEYTASYQNYAGSWEKKKAKTNTNKAVNVEPLELPPWNISMRPNNEAYAPSLAADEAKLEVLDEIKKFMKQMIDAKEKKLKEDKVPDSPVRYTSMSRDAILRRDHPRDFIRASLLEDDDDDDDDDEDAEEKPPAEKVDKQKKE